MDSSLRLWGIKGQAENRLVPIDNAQIPVGCEYRVARIQIGVVNRLRPSAIDQFPGPGFDLRQTGL